MHILPIIDVFTGLGDTFCEIDCATIGMELHWQLSSSIVRTR
jgi:hypothetical protein